MSIFFFFLLKRKLGDHCGFFQRKTRVFIRKLLIAALFFHKITWKGEFSFFLDINALPFLLRHTRVFPLLLFHVFITGAPAGDWLLRKGGKGEEGKGHTDGRTDGGGRNRKNGPCQVFFVLYHTNAKTWRRKTAAAAGKRAHNVCRVVSRKMETSKSTNYILSKGCRLFPSHLPV